MSQRRVIIGPGLALSCLVSGAVSASHMCLGSESWSPNHQLPMYVCPTLLQPDPEMRSVFEDVEQNGQTALFKYMGNPSVMAKVQPLLGKMMGSMMGGAMGM